MNERIRDLALDAIVKNAAADLWVFTDAELEKFAESIIKECAELTLDYKSETYYNGWLDYRDTIKNHFEIK